MAKLLIPQPLPHTPPHTTNPLFPKAFSLSINDITIYPLAQARNLEHIFDCLSSLILLTNELKLGK